MKRRCKHKGGVMSDNCNYWATGDLLLLLILYCLQFCFATFLMSKSTFLWGKKKNVFPEYQSKRWQVLDCCLQMKIAQHVKQHTQRTKPSDKYSLFSWREISLQRNKWNTAHSKLDLHFNKEPWHFRYAMCAQTWSNWEMLYASPDENLVRIKKYLIVLNAIFMSIESSFICVILN